MNPTSVDLLSADLTLTRDAIACNDAPGGHQTCGLPVQYPIDYLARVTYNNK